MRASGKWPLSLSIWHAPSAMVKSIQRRAKARALRTSLWASKYARSARLPERVHKPLAFRRVKGVTGKTHPGPAVFGLSTHRTSRQMQPSARGPRSVARNGQLALPATVQGEWHLKRSGSIRKYGRYHGAIDLSASIVNLCRQETTCHFTLLSRRSAYASEGCCPGREPPRQLAQS
jgi:hypothetical protein